MMSTLKNPFAPFDAALAAAFESNIRAALIEDVGSGDLTGKLVPEHERVKARVIVREAAVLCGAPWFEGVMKQLDARIRIEWRYEEGALMTADSEVCAIEAPARASHHRPLRARIRRMPRTPPEPRPSRLASKQRVPRPRPRWCGTSSKWSME